MVLSVFEDVSPRKGGFRYCVGTIKPQVFKHCVIEELKIKYSLLAWVVSKCSRKRIGLIAV